MQRFPTLSRKLVLSGVRQGLHSGFLASLDDVGTVLSSTSGVYSAMVNGKSMSVDVFLNEREFSKWDYEKSGLFGYDIRLIGTSSSSGVCVGNWTSLESVCGWFDCYGLDPLGALSSSVEWAAKLGILHDLEHACDFWNELLRPNGLSCVARDDESITAFVKDRLCEMINGIELPKDCVPLLVEQDAGAMDFCYGAVEDMRSTQIACQFSRKSMAKWTCGKLGCICTHDEYPGEYFATSAGHVIGTPENTIRSNTLHPETNMEAFATTQGWWSPPVPKRINEPGSVYYSPRLLTGCPTRVEKGWVHIGEAMNDFCVVNNTHDIGIVQLNENFDISKMGTVVPGLRWNINHGEQCYILLYDGPLSVNNTQESDLHKTVAALVYVGKAKYGTFYYPYSADSQCVMSPRAIKDFSIFKCAPENRGYKVGDSGSMIVDQDGNAIASSFGGCNMDQNGFHQYIFGCSLDPINEWGFKVKSSAHEGTP